MGLLSGPLLLVGFWERFRRQTPKLQRVKGCHPDIQSEMVHCSLGGSIAWRAAMSSRRVLGHNTADRFALLSAVREEHDANWELKQ